MASSLRISGNRQLVIIVFARYFNLLVEYLLLVATAVLMTPSGRGEYVMYMSVIAFFTLIAGLAYEQYGAAIQNKYTNEFDGRNFFSFLVFYTVLIGLFASFFVLIWLKGTVITSILIALNIIAMNVGRQSVVFFQVYDEAEYYFKRFILYKTLYCIAISYAVFAIKSIEIILLFILISNVIFLYLIRAHSLNRYSKKINASKFISDFSRVKFLYITALITGCYSFVDLYIIFTKLDATNLSTYNLAIQLNMAVAVVGQAYNVHIYSKKGSHDMAFIFISMRKVNLFIVGISVLCIGITHLDIFAKMINLIFESEYKNLVTVIRSTIFLLPASLVSMFYAPIWISSERYFILMLASVGGLILFTFSALTMVHLGIEGIIYAQYFTSTYIILVNIAYLYYAKTIYLKSNQAIS